MLYINAVCDLCKKTSQSAAFDADEETLGDLKKAYETQMGWKIEGGPGSKNLKLSCPSCLQADEDS